MNELQQLLEQYKWIVNKLEKINRNYDNIEKYEKLLNDYKKLKNEYEGEKSKNKYIQDMNKTLMLIIKKFNWIEICKQCNWEWGFNDWHWGCLICKECEWTWIIINK